MRAMSVELVVGLLFQLTALGIDSPLSEVDCHKLDKATSHAPWRLQEQHRLHDCIYPEARSAATRLLPPHMPSLHLPVQKKPL
jgi:hypothetical protein